MSNFVYYLVLVVGLVLSLYSHNLHAAQDISIPVDYSITTIMGGQIGDGYKATMLPIDKPRGLAVDPRNGNIYYSSVGTNQVRYFDSNNGVSHYFAGSLSYKATNGAVSTGATFANATLNNPYGVAVSSTSGDVYVVEFAGKIVKKIFYNSTMNANYMQLFAGGGGLVANGIPALSTSFFAPRCVAVSPKDEVYICDTSRIVKVVNQTVYAVVGNGVYGSSSDGVLATNANIGTPYSIAFDPLSGDMYFADKDSGLIRYVSSTDGKLYTRAVCEATSIAFQSGGELYASNENSNQVYRIIANVKNLIAGSSVELSGFSGDGGNAQNATFDGPSGLAVYGNNLYISDSNNNRIRKIDLTTKIIETVAGNGNERLQILEGSVSNITLLSPESTFYSAESDELFIVDSSQSVVLSAKSISNYNNSLVDLIAGEPNSPSDSIDGIYHPYSVFQAENTDVYIGQLNNIMRLSDGILSVVAGSNGGSAGDGYQAISSRLSDPSGMAITSNDEIYFCDYNSIRKIDSRGIISTVAGSIDNGFINGPALNARFYTPRYLALMPNGDLIISDYFNWAIRRLSISTGNVSTIVGTGYTNYNGDGLFGNATNINYPGGVCVNATSGDIYYSDVFNYRIRRIDAKSGRVYTVIGTGLSNTFTDDGFNGTSTNVNPSDIAIHPITNELYFSDTSQRIIRKLSAVDGKVRTVIGTTADLGGVTYFTFSPSGDLLISSTSSYGIKKLAYGGSSVSSIPGASFPTNPILYPIGIVVSNINGDVIFADTKTDKYIKRITSAGVVSTIAGGIGDRGPAINALVSSVKSMALTGSDLYLSSGNRIRKVSLSSGIISTVVGTLETIDNGDKYANETNINIAGGITIRNNDLIYSDSGNFRIKKTDLSGNGKVTTMYGVTYGYQVSSQDGWFATDATFTSIESISYLPNGELIIADSGNNVIRKVDLNGRITAIAGQYFQPGFNGDSSNAKKALLDNPKGLSIMNDGRIIFADSNNVRIRMLTPYCPEGYFLAQSSNGTVCNLTTCFGVALSDSKVCSGRGSCVSANTCLCANGYSGVNCEFANCFGIPSNNASVCSGNGVCKSLDLCICSNGYYGAVCGQKTVVENITTCYGVAFNDSKVCSGNGICQSLDNCNCSTQYYGANCEQKVIVKVDNITTCYGIAFNDSSVCSGHGLCQSLNNCNCSSGYSGLNCSTKHTPPKDDDNTPQADYCTLYPDSFVCSSSSVNTTETQITKVSNISQLDSKTIQFSSTSTISIALPPIISQYLQNLDVSLKNDTVQVVSSISEKKSSNSEASNVISTIVSLVLVKSSSSEKISVQNLEQPISISFSSVTVLVPNKDQVNISCVYFDEISKEWKSDGLKTQIENQVISQTLSDGNITLTLSIKCKTNHLTSFSVIDQNYKKANNQPNTVQDKAIVQDSAVLIGAIVGSIGGVCVIATIITLIIVVVCLAVRKKKYDDQQE